MTFADLAIISQCKTILPAKDAAGRIKQKLKPELKLFNFLLPTKLSYHCLYGSRTGTADGRSSNLDGDYRLRERLRDADGVKLT